MFKLDDFKYGFCSYYALAYCTLKKDCKVIIINEYDEEMEKDYFVHMAMYDESSEKPFKDALGKYSDLTEMMDFVDIVVENCSWEFFDSDEIKSFIIADMGFFDEDIFQTAIKYVNEK